MDTILTTKLQRQHGFTLIELMVVIIIIGILIGVALPNFMGAQDKAKISSVKANMHAIQLGIEHFASDHAGNYPDAVSDTTVFNWSSYIPSNPKNPFNQSIVGAANMEADVTISDPSGAPVFTLASAYSTAGTQGNMRYFTDTGNHSTYALIGEDKTGNIIKETSAAGSTNYVLHN